MNNKKMIRKSSKKKLAKLLARICRAAVVAYEYSEHKYCTKKYWKEWLKEQCDS